MPMERTLERSMTSSLYGVLGITVTYTPTVGSPSSIYAIPSDFSGAFAANLGVQVQQSETVFRVQKSDISAPVRGDTLTDADTNVFEVEDYADQNAVEWALTVRKT